MELRGAISSASVCRDCWSALRKSKGVGTASRLAAATRIQTPPWTSGKRNLSNTSRSQPTRRPQHCRTDIRRYATETPSRSTASPAAQGTLDLNAVHTRIQELSASVLKPEVDNGNVSLPSDQRVLYVFEQMQSMATAILDEQRPARAPRPEPASAAAAARRGGKGGGGGGGDDRGIRRRQETATSALLGSVNARQYPGSISRASILSLLSDKALEIVRHPDVFVTSPVLSAYVELQSLLQQPWSFPDLFDAYARKPAPIVRGNAVEYKPVSPDHMNAAIDSKTANAALSAAMLAHNLPLAIDVITTSFCTPAFKKAKILKQAAIPIGGLAVAPLAAYALSSSFSSFQQTMDPALATNIAFAGIMTYIGAVSMVGYVTITTANDQMDRITWAPGIPLWERWLREDERAAADRVAAAWGFKDRDRRGEEEGDEWETLREWVGQRGMILDRVNLMDGME